MGVWGKAAAEPPHSKGSWRIEAQRVLGERRCKKSMRESRRRDEESRSFVAEGAPQDGGEGGRWRGVVGFKNC
jgi:hypothetical protein